MEDRRKIKDIYGYTYIVSDEKLYPLQKWYNQLIDKSISEITLSDVLRMIRQKIFVDLAMSKALLFLHENVFAGNAYDGELLDHLATMDAAFLTPYANALKDVLLEALENCKTHEWAYDGEKEEFEEILHLLSEKIA